MDLKLEERMLNEICKNLAFKTPSGKYTINPLLLYRTLFSDGPTRVVIGSARIRHFERDDEQKDIYVYVLGDHGLETEINRQMFGICVSDRLGGNTTTVAARGISGVLNTLNGLCRDEYDILYERRIGHGEHMLDFQEYLRRTDDVNNIPVIIVNEDDDAMDNY
jgi:hypothetical protein